MFVDFCRHGLAKTDFHIQHDPKLIFKEAINKYVKNQRPHYSLRHPSGLSATGKKRHISCHRTRCLSCKFYQISHFFVWLHLHRLHFLCEQVPLLKVRPPRGHGSRNVRPRKKRKAKHSVWSKKMPKRKRRKRRKKKSSQKIRTHWI